MIHLYIKVPQELVCHFLGQVLGCAYTICSYGQIIIIIIIIIIILENAKDTDLFSIWGHTDNSVLAMISLWDSAFGDMVLF